MSWLASVVAGALIGLGAASIVGAMLRPRIDRFWDDRFARQDDLAALRCDESHSDASQDRE